MIKLIRICICIASPCLSLLGERRIFTTRRRRRRRGGGGFITRDFVSVAARRRRKLSLIAILTVVDVVRGLTFPGPDPLILIFLKGSKCLLLGSLIIFKPN